MEVSSIRHRVQKHRANLRAQGLRPVQIWVPDTRKAGFLEECARQARLASEADTCEEGLKEFMDIALKDIEGWE